MSKRALFITCVLASFLYLNLSLNILPAFSKESTSIEKLIVPLNIKDLTLDNGLNVLIQENHKDKLIAIEIIVKTGSIYEDSSQGSGLAHLTEHMLFKGSSKRNAIAIEDEIKALGGSINGYTSHQLTGFTLVLPAENFKNGFEILADMLVNPLFDVEEIKKEKEVILNEIRLTRDDPDRYLSQIFWKTSYPIAPFNLPIIGIEPLFEKLDRQAISDFHKKWYVPNNMIVAIAGDTDPNSALEIIKSSFAGFTMQPFPVTALPDIPALKGQLSYEEEYDTSLCYMLIGYPSVVITDRDSAILDVIAAILAQGESSLLYKKLVRQEQIVHSVVSFNYTPGFKGIFAIKCVLDPGKRNQVLQAITDQMELLKTTPLKSYELEKTKQMFLSDYIFSQETVASQAKNIATDKFYTSNANFSQSYLKSITSITPADIQRCARKYFSSDNFTNVVILPNTEKRPLEIEQKVVDSPVKEVLLENGTQVLLKQDLSSPTVSVAACFEGGVRMEAESQRGIFNCLSQMLLRGTRKYTAEEISSIFDHAGARLSAFSGYNSFGLSLDSLKENFPGLFRIYLELLFEPDIKDKELSLQKQLVLKAIVQENDDIFRDSYNKLKKALFNSYPQRFNPLGEPETVASFKRDDLVDIHKKYVTGDNLVIAVFGNFNEEKTLKYLKEFLSKKSNKRDLREPVFEEKIRNQSLLIENFREKKQAIFMIAFPGCDLASPDRYGLEIVNSLLTSPGSILYQKIRERYGLAYTLGGDSVNGVDSGFLFIYAATKPESIEQIKDIVTEEIKKIQAGNFDDNLFKNTKIFLIAKHRLELESTANLCFTVALNVLYGLGVDHYQKYEDNIRNIEKAEIMEITKKYLQLEKSAMVITKEKI